MSLQGLHRPAKPYLPEPRTGKASFTSINYLQCMQWARISRPADARTLPPHLLTLGSNCWHAAHKTKLGKVNLHGQKGAHMMQERKLRMARPP